jgi:hypothetical protein
MKIFRPRQRGPNNTVYIADKHCIWVEFRFDARNLLHRESDEGPAVTYFYGDGTVEEEQWWWHGLRHRDGGKPAIVRHHGDGEVWDQKWFRFGRCHRRDGPAMSYDSGPFQTECWYVHGYPYRDPREGPHVQEVFPTEGAGVPRPVYSEEIPPRSPVPVSWLRGTFGKPPKIIL